MNGERIKLARKRAGLSLRDLAAAMDNIVSAQAIGKYERDEMTPGSKVLTALTKALGVSLSYLMAPNAVVLGEVEFRSKSNTSAKERAKVETAVLEAVERYLQIENILELDSSRWHCPKKMPREIMNTEEAEKLADDLRKAWNLGIDSIPNMTELLEEKGIKVLLEELPEKVSGLTCFVQHQEKNPVPVIVVNKSINLERRRFTLAHELGHRVISSSNKPSQEVEKLCNCFAGAFLVPRVHLISEIGENRSSMSYRELLDLKKLYRVSASALLVRLEQVAIIDQNTLRYAFRTFARSWRTEEPEPLADANDLGQFEQPRRFERLVYRALAEDLISRSKAAELLRLSINEVEKGLKGPVDADCC